MWIEPWDITSLQGSRCYDQPTAYLAYLLRPWRVGKEDEAAWRASLEDTHSGERQGFADLDALFEYVRSQTRVGPSQYSCAEDEGENDRRERRWSAGDEVYVKREADKPVALRFVLVGEDHCPDRQDFLDGKTVKWVEP